MYAESIVAKRLDLIANEIGRIPDYHSHGEIDEFNAYLENKYSEEYRAAAAAAQGSQDPNQAFQVSLARSLCDPQSTKLNKEEIAWIEGERYLCLADAAYWMTRYFWVKNEKNILQRFTFRQAQRAYFDVVSELEARGAAIEIIACKARQLGVTTVTEGLVTHRICFHYGVNAVCASADRTKTRIMAQIMLLAYDLMPWWLRPLSSRRVESDQGMLVFGGMRSGVSFQHGAQTSGVARGWTPTLYHLSEVAEYSNPEDLIEASLFRAVHPSPGVFGVRREPGVGAGAAIHAPGLRAGGDRGCGQVQKKSRWAAGHGAVEQDGAMSGVNVQRVCRKLGMSRQNYYARRQARQRRQVDGELVAELVRRERQLQPRLGVRKLHHQLKGQLAEAGVKLGRDRMFEELAQRGLLVPALPAPQPRTTHSRHNLPVFRNLVSEVVVELPNEVWVSDLSYLRTQEGFLYLGISPQRSSVLQ